MKPSISKPNHEFVTPTHPGQVYLFIAILWILILGSYKDSYCQVSDTTTYRVETKDGNEYLGKILFEDPDKITLITKTLGEIKINKMDILKIEAIRSSQVKNGVLWFDNPQASRYFWMPNGYGVKKGEGYYQNVWIFFNQFTVAPTDNFSIGFGIVPTFLFGASTPAWVTGKFSIPVVPDKFNIGAGILAGTVLGEENSGFGIAYGMTTFGSRDTNLSIGLGYGQTSGDWAKHPTISVSALIRTSNRGYFITENYLIGTGEDPLVLISFGGRRIVKKVGIDFGLFLPFSTGMDFIAIPWLGLTVPFGSSKKI
jgi:hypothetical protein